MGLFYYDHLMKYIYYLTLGLIIWAPIPIASNRPWAWAILEVAIALLICASLTRTRSLTPLLRPYKETLAILSAFCLWQLIQVIVFSIDPFQSVTTLLKSTAYASFFVLLCIHCTSKQHLNQLLLVILISGALQASYGVISTLSSPNESLVLGISNNASASGSFIYKNHFGNFVAISALIGLGLLLNQLTQKNSYRHWLEGWFDGKLALRLTIMIMVIALVMSHSRMPNAAFFTALCCFSLASLWLFRHSSSVKKLCLILLSLFVIDVAVLSHYFGLEKLKERVISTTLTEEIRVDVVADSLPLIREAPLTGYGGGSFYTAFPQSLQTPTSSIWDHAHNDYLQFMIEFGVIATLVLIILIVRIFIRGLIRMFQTRNPWRKSLLAGCNSAILAQAFMLTTDFHLQSPANAILFIGVMFGTQYLSRQHNDQLSHK